MWKELVPYYGNGSNVESSTIGFYDNDGASYVIPDLSKYIAGDCSGTADSVPLDQKMGMIQWSTGVNNTENFFGTYGANNQGDSYAVGAGFVIGDGATNNTITSVSAFKWGDTVLEGPTNGEGGALQYFPIQFFGTNPNAGTNESRILKIATDSTGGMPASSADVFYDLINMIAPNDYTGGYIAQHPDGLLLSYNSNRSAGDELHLRFNSQYHNFNNGLAAAPDSWTILPSHNHDEYEYVSGSGGNAVFTDGLLKPNPNNGTVASITVNNNQYQSTLTHATTGDKWLIYNLNKNGSTYGNHLTPAASSPAALQTALDASQTSEWASLNAATTAAGVSHDFIRQNFTPVFYDQRIATIENHEWMGTMGAPGGPTYIVDPDGSGGSAAVTLSNELLVGSNDNTYTASVFIWGNFLFANFTHIKAKESGITTNNEGTAATDWVWTILNAKVLVPQVVIGDLDVEGGIAYSLNMNFDLQNDITDAANITNLIKVETGTINESEETSPFGTDANGGVTNTPFLSLNGGSAGSYASTSLYMGTVDNDDTVDNLKDFYLGWTHPSGASGGNIPGTTKGEYVALTHLTGAQFTPDSASNPFTTQFNNISDRDALSNQDVLDLFEYNPTYNVCDRALAPVIEVLDAYTDDFSNSGIITMRGDMWNKPGTTIDEGVVGHASEHARVFVRVPSYNDGYATLNNDGIN